ncbi:peptidoglycan DD-metalloendopeptidase family protein [bacterium]|nr:peptidoglycan DD-metalloendopeptidase family protein [bacterium]
MKKPPIRILLILALLCSFAPAMAQSPGSLRKDLRDTKSQLHYQQSRLDTLNERERDLARQLSNSQYDLQESRTALNNTIARLENAQNRYEDIQTRLSIATEKYKHSLHILGQRLRDIYMQGDMGYLLVLLGSQSFTDFLDYAHYISIIVSRDYDLLDEVRQLKAELTSQAQAAQEALIEMRQLRDAQEERVSKLSKIEQRRAELLSDVQSQRDKVARYVTELEGSTQELENKLHRTITKRQSYARPHIPQKKRTWGTGRYITPAEGPITSPYGYRIHPIFGTMRFHSGIDIGAYYGSSILAADSGIVIEAGWIGGYGNTVMIDHGGGYSTLYGHCSQLYVHPGQMVSQGEAIAAVGSTGNSTGPHLHFEVRINGDPVDPLGFI